MQASETYMITVACPCSQPANRIQTDAYLTNRKSREHAGALGKRPRRVGSVRLLAAAGLAPACVFLGVTVR